MFTSALVEALLADCIFGSTIMIVVNVDCYLRLCSVVFLEDSGRFSVENGMGGDQMLGMEQAGRNTQQSNVGQFQ